MGLVMCDMYKLDGLIYYEEDKSQYIRDYLDKYYEEKSRKELQEELGLTKSGLLYHLKNGGYWNKEDSLPVVAKRMADFFKEWSSEMAYVLGYLYADGHYYVSEKSDGYIYHGIIFRSIDKDMIESVYEIMECNQKIREQKSKFEGEYTGKNVYTLEIGSKYFKDILPELGIKSNRKKTFEESDVEIKEGYEKYFWLGFFDGDGSITKKKYNYNERGYRYEVIFIFTSYNMRSKLLDWLEDREISYSTTEQLRDGREKEILFTYVSSIECMRKLRDLFYSNFNYGMERKKNRFMDL